jgi:hypothetical protein
MRHPLAGCIRLSVPYEMGVPREHVSTEALDLTVHSQPLECEPSTSMRLLCLPESSSAQGLTEEPEHGLLSLRTRQKSQFFARKRVAKIGSPPDGGRGE